LTDKPLFPFPHYSFLRLHVAPFNNPSPRQDFSVSLLQKSGFPTFCQVVLLVLTWKQARACAGVRQIETDEPSMCWTAAHASHHGGASKKATSLNMPAKTLLFKRWMSRTLGQHRCLFRICFTPWLTFFST
jgi:hypothetical protein